MQTLDDAVRQHLENRLTMTASRVTRLASWAEIVLPEDLFDRHANMEVNYLLQRLDSFEGSAILTTSFGSAIDLAFRRRLTYRVTGPGQGAPGALE